jgi:hypothetical protein
VEIGEKGNTCVLTKEQYETLKDKILKKELEIENLKGKLIAPHTR